MTGLLWAIFCSGAGWSIGVLATRGLRQIDRPRQSYAQGELDMRAFRKALEDGVIEIDESGQVVYVDRKGASHDR